MPEIGEPFGHTKKITYQHGHAYYWFQMIGGTVYRIGEFTYWIDGRKEVTIDREGCPE